MSIAWRTTLVALAVLVLARSTVLGVTITFEDVLGPLGDQDSLLINDPDGDGDGDPLTVDGVLLTDVAQLVGQDLLFGMTTGDHIIVFADPIFDGFTMTFPGPVTEISFDQAQGAVFRLARQR